MGVRRIAGRLAMKSVRGYEHFIDNRRASYHLRHARRFARRYVRRKHSGAPELRGPVAFVGQKEYFRQAYYDWTSTGQHFAFDLNSFDHCELRALPSFCKKHGIKTCIIFRPEWFAKYRKEFSDLKSMNVKVVGFSTEPVVRRLDGKETHLDQVSRLLNLLQALTLDYDLFVHYDELSREALTQLNFGPLICWPIPVSRRLFYPNETDKTYDFCFLGRSTPYRESFLWDLKARFNLIHVAHGMNDEAANEIMSKSKIVLNIHNLDYLNFETRVVQALLCKRPLISDPLIWNILKAGQDYIEVRTPEDLSRVAHDLISNNKWSEFGNYSTDLSVFDINTFMKRIGYTDEIPSI